MVQYAHHERLIHMTSLCLQSCEHPFSLSLSKGFSPLPTRNQNSFDPLDLMKIHKIFDMNRLHTGSGRITRTGPHRFVFLLLLFASGRLFIVAPFSWPSYCFGTSSSRVG